MKSLGKVAYMPGTQGFTMAVFSANDVPTGGLVYVDGKGFVVGDLPGCGGAFTMVVFNAELVPEGTSVFINNGTVVIG